VEALTSPTARLVTHVMNARATRADQSVTATLRLFVILLTASQVACFPYKYTMRPAVTGRVVSARDERPIANALISDPQSKALQAATSQDGTFVLPARKQWGIWFILPQEPLRGWPPLEVSAAGYETAAAPSPRWQPKRVLQMDQPIRLQPAGEQSR
jgi:hypothetical protein